MKTFYESLPLMLIIAIASLILHPFIWIVIVFGGFFDSEAVISICTFVLIYIIVGGLIRYMCRKMSWRKQAFAIFLSVNSVIVIAFLLYTYHAIQDGMTGFMYITICFVNVILSAIPISLGCYLAYKKTHLQIENHKTED